MEAISCLRANTDWIVWQPEGWREGPDRIAVVDKSNGSFHWIEGLSNGLILNRMVDLGDKFSSIEFVESVTT